MASIYIPASENDSFLNIDDIHIPLSGYRYLRTRSPDKVNAALATNFHHGVVEVYKKNKFKIAYNHISVGDVSFNAAAASSGFHIQADSDARSFVLIATTHGQVTVRTQDATTVCVPEKFASLLDFQQPCVIAVQPYYNSMTVRFTRPAIEQALEKRTGNTLRRPLRFANQIDLSQPGPRRLLAIIDQVVAFFEQDPALANERLLVGQYEQLLLTALLACLDHNGRELLSAPPTPAPPKVIALVEGFLEANADKPLNLGDLTALTGMSARSVQLAFQRHRGYSPSRFLRECRLARAREMLRRAAPGASVLSVSLACGFASQSFFCRLYRERFGETPSETAAKS